MVTAQRQRRISPAQLTAVIFRAEDKLIPKNRRAEELLEIYQYDLRQIGKSVTDSRLRFTPQRAVLEGEESLFLVDIALHYYANQIDMSENITVHLSGETNSAEQYEKVREIVLIRRLIKVLELEELDRYQRLMSHFDELSAGTLNKCRRTVFDEGIEYQTAKYTAYASWAGFMDKVLVACSASRWLGDMALSYIIKVYSPVLGPYSEAVIMPLKDFAVDVIGECLSSYIWEDKMVSLDKINKITADKYENHRLCKERKHDWTADYQEMYRRL